ncbi:MAG TPA: substrate-binding domain-containing protein [Holophaga sp.]|nr:substrate-binding domain-containing protein [Holophaga sp.]
MVRPVMTILLATACLALQAQGVVRVGGGTAIQAIFEPIKPHLEAERGIRLVLSDRGPDAAFRDLMAGRLEVAVAGTSMEGWVDMMRAQGHAVRPPYEYKHIQIGEDRLSVLVNPDVVTDVDVLLMELPRDKIRGLFTGRIRNWREVGGPDLPVTVVLGRRTAGANREFRQKALGGEPFAADAREVGTVPEIIEALRTIPGAIGIGPHAVTSNTKIWSPVQAPQVVRPFTLLVRDGMPPEQRKAVARMVEYLLGPGRKHLAP